MQEVNKSQAKDIFINTNFILTASSFKLYSNFHHSLFMMLAMLLVVWVLFEAILSNYHFSLDLPVPVFELVWKILPS